MSTLHIVIIKHNKIKDFLINVYKNKNLSNTINEKTNLIKQLENQVLEETNKLESEYNKNKNVVNQINEKTNLIKNLEKKFQEQ